jgi:hypothetical protein
MKPVIFLRIASVLTLVHALMHTVGGVFGKQSPGTIAMVVATMKANTFPVFGVTRSFWDFYFGMGLGISISLTVEGVVLWMLASLAKTNAARLRPILWVFLLGYSAIAVNSYFNFFYGPVIAEILIALFLGLAIFSAQPAAHEAPITANA